jgi:hypothetical protein
MSSTGSCDVMYRDRWPACLAAARRVTTATTGRWIFRRTEALGLDEFRHQWGVARLRSLDFDYPGEALGSYLDAQQAISGASPVDRECEIVKTLARFFTAAFPFETATPLLDLPRDRILTFCRDRFGEAAPDMVEEIEAAHTFYRRGLREVTAKHLVVFVID